MWIPQILAIACLVSMTGPGISASQKKEYKLVWADEFNKDGRPDPKNWTYETGFVRNRELQWYQPDNAFCRDGILIIEARRERTPNPSYDSAARDW
jgi:beta-glucanase (GH16 family)